MSANRAAKKPAKKYKLAAPSEEQRFTVASKKDVEDTIKYLEGLEAYWVHSTSTSPKLPSYVHRTIKLLKVNVGDNVQ